MSTLVRFLRPDAKGDSRQARKSMQVEAAVFRTALAAISKSGLGRFELTDDVVDHLLRKRLIHEEYHNLKYAGEGRGLTFAKLVALNLPDEPKVLPRINSYTRRNGQLVLAEAFNCHPLFLTHFACLARGVLRQCPGALFYTQEVDNHYRIRAVLRHLKTKQKQQKQYHNPSLIQFYKNFWEIQ